MSIRNGIFWAFQIRKSFLSDIDAFARCLSERLLPTFAKVEQEAERVEQETWERPGYSEDIDPGELAEKARDKSVEFLQTMKSVQQGLINMFAAGLWHLFEQKLLVLYHRELVGRDYNGRCTLRARCSSRC